MEKTDIPYEPVRQCPLCGGRGGERAALRRRHYSFGPFIIPLPPDGIRLLACEGCNLLFKSAVPEARAFGRIMAAAAAKVWRPKTGVHPAVAPIMGYLPAERVDILDIGASNGDLLAQLRDRAGRLSALDIERFPRCEAVVTGEYIIGEVEQPLHWSGIPYGLVTAFDVFEHFRDPGRAVDTIVGMTAADGLIVIETGDWSTAAGHLDGVRAARTQAAFSMAAAPTQDSSTLALPPRVPTRPGRVRPSAARNDFASPPCRDRCPAASSTSA